MSKNEINNPFAIAWLSERTALLSLSCGVSVQIPKEKVEPAKGMLIRFDVSRVFARAIDRNEDVRHIVRLHGLDERATEDLDIDHGFTMLLIQW